MRQQHQQQLQNHEKVQQQHSSQLQHQHEHCKCENYEEDTDIYQTSTQIGHRHRPLPVLQEEEDSNVNKYQCSKLVEEIDPLMKTLPFETTNRFYHNRKIFERDHLNHYNRPNVTVDTDPETFKGHAAPQYARPFPTSEYRDRHRCTGVCQTVTTELPSSNPEECFAKVDAFLEAAENLDVQNIGPNSLDVMCDVTPANAALMKLLDPYISVFQFDFVYPEVDSQFFRYKQQLIDNYMRNRALNMMTARKPQEMKDALAVYEGTTSLPLEENLNNTNFGALQYIPRSTQPVPNFGYTTEMKDHFGDPRNPLNRGYRTIACYDAPVPTSMCVNEVFSFCLSQHVVLFISTKKFPLSSSSSSSDVQSD
ncbi:hypothetical protein WDU94_011085 [Cyamophila willieti]